jgi:site-specific DNA-cytosine methylase
LFGGFCCALGSHQTLPHQRAGRRLFDASRRTVVLFAGLGGVCIGVERAPTSIGRLRRDRYIDLPSTTGTSPSRARAEPPITQHLHCDVREVDPARVLPGRKIGYLHLSPDCTDFSKAKGGKPKRKHIRALADVGSSGPVLAGRTCSPSRTSRSSRTGGRSKSTGSRTRRGAARSSGAGSASCRRSATSSSRELRACDYGAPTTRKRLFVIARCDGKPIVWPEKTHGKCDLRSDADSRGDQTGARRSCTWRQPRRATGCSACGWYKKVIPASVAALDALREAMTTQEYLLWDRGSPES